MTDDFSHLALPKNQIKPQVELNALEELKSNTSLKYLCKLSVRELKLLITYYLKNFDSEKVNKINVSILELENLFDKLVIYPEMFPNVKGVAFKDPPCPIYFEIGEKDEL